MHISSGKLHLPCQVHKAHGVAKAMYGLVDDCASGMIKTALALRSGHMKKFRQAFKDIISSELTIWHGGDPVRLVSGPQVDGHRKFMLNTFFSTLSSDEKACIESVFNSNWETPFLEHYCHGCCENREETIAKAHKLVKFFCAASPRIFPRRGLEVMSVLIILVVFNQYMDCFKRSSKSFSMMLEQSKLTIRTRTARRKTTSWQWCHQLWGSLPQQHLMT